MVSTVERSWETERKGEQKGILILIVEREIGAGNLEIGEGTWNLEIGPGNLEIGAENLGT